MTIRFAAVAIDGGKKKSQDNIFMTYKEIVILLFLAFCVSTAEAQKWTKADSVKLNRILKGNKEIQINQHELQNIHFDAKIMNNPLLEPMQLNHISPDETLPQDAGKKYVLTMNPYKASTPYNWDPIYHCKIVKVGNHWEPQLASRRYSEGARAYDMAAGISAQIAAIKGLRGLSLGNGVYVNGGTISGLDLMYFFEKRFWDFKQNAIRKRTQEVLKAYDKAVPTLPTKESKNN
jgi:hypothetical protein